MYMNSNDFRFIKLALTILSVLLGMVFALLFTLTIVTVNNTEKSMNKETQAELIEVCVEDDNSIAFDLSGNGKHFCIMGRK